MFACIFAAFLFRESFLHERMEPEALKDMLCMLCNKADLRCVIMFIAACDSSEDVG